MAHSPLEQFRIKNWFDLTISGIDVSFTNSSFFMLAVVLAIVSLLGFVPRSRSLIPTRMQSINELLYQFIAGMIKENLGEEGRKYFPFVFSIFMFVLFCNLFGMLPYSFTVTSHIIITFGIAIILFLVIFIMAFLHHGLKFLSIFVPKGAPLWLAPLLILIELFSYLARPVSLSIRLAANMTAGHTMMKVIAAFIAPLGIMGAWLPIGFLVILTGFEIFVAILQAYIFTMLACVYLNDTIHLH